MKEKAVAPSSVLADYGACDHDVMHPPVVLQCDVCNMDTDKDLQLARLLSP